MEPEHAAMERDARFAETVRTHKDRIFRICGCYVRNESDRKDVYQEVLIRLWQGLGSFRGESSLSTWVYRITVNTCLLHLRAERTRRTRIDHRVAPDELPNPEGGSEGDEADLRHLHQCIGKLPLLERTLVSLSLEEVATKEMAEILGMSDGAVRVRLHRARRQLQKLWGRN